MGADARHRHGLRSDLPSIRYFEVQLDRPDLATATSGDAFGRFDLYTALLHELGHTIGLDDFSHFGSSITITSPRPFSGSLFQLQGSAHITGLSTTVMDSSITTGIREYLSDADILVQAEILGFTDTSVQPASVPEPLTMALAMAGAGLYMRRRLRRP